MIVNGAMRFWESSNSTRLHQQTPTTTKVQLSTANNNSQLHTATVDILLHQLTPITTTVRLSTDKQQQLASHCNCGHHSSSADTYHHYSATVNSIQQQSASYCNCGHPNKSADTYQHHSATVHSIQ